MTNKEAINLLSRNKSVFQYDTDMLIAIDLAIKALMAYRDCRHCTHNIKVGNMRGCALWDCDFEEQKGGAE